MNNLQAIRDSIREDYEQRIAELEGKNTLKVVEFQIQLRTPAFSAKELLHQVDPGAPIPQALEGGDMKGPLYQCILDGSRLTVLKGLVEDGFLTMYTMPKPMMLAETMYRPDWYVQWQMGGPPKVSAKPS